MRSTHPGNLRFGARPPKTKLEKLKSISKIAGGGLAVGIVAVLIYAILVVLGSADTLAVVFIVLKLTHNIGWSWLAVFSPWIATAVIGLVALVVCLGILIVTEIIDR